MHNLSQKFTTFFNLFLPTVVFSCEVSYIFCFKLENSARELLLHSAKYVVAEWLFFLSLVSQILYWQKFALQFAKMSYLLSLVTYMTCNLALTAVNVLICSPEHFTFFEIQDFIISETMCRECCILFSSTYSVFSLKYGVNNTVWAIMPKYILRF